MENLEFGKEKKNETYTRGYSHTKSTGLLIIHTYFILFGVLYTGLLVGCGKKVKFRGIFRAKFAEKTADFAEISRKFSRPASLKTIGKQRLISWEIPEQISLESNWFCADLRKVFNETRRSYRFTQGAYRNMKSYFTSKLTEHNKNK